MGIDEIFLRKQQGGKEEQFEDWWSARVHGVVIVSAHVWRRWDARPCAWPALVVTKSQQAKRGAIQARPTADELRVASCTTFRLAELRMHISRVAAASTLHATKTSTCQIFLEKILPNSKWVVSSFGKGFWQFWQYSTNMLPINFTISIENTIISYHIILYHMLN
jgi:hypothetical protein